MPRWLNRLAQLLGCSYSLKIRTLPFGAKAGFGDTMIHVAFQCLDDLVSHPEFCLQDYDSNVQDEIVELYWWWKSTRPYRTPLMPNDLSQEGIEVRIVYMEEDSEMLERLVTLRSYLAL
jgi:hypothetical protein